MTFDGPIIQISRPRYLSTLRRDRLLSRFRGKTKYLFIPTCIRRHVKETASEVCHNISLGKTRVAWLPECEKNLRIYLAVFILYTNVADWQLLPPAAVHRTTAYRPRLCIASLGKLGKCRCNCSKCTVKMQ